jgi:hypothetical protein
MDSIASRVATRWTISKTFLLKDPQKELKGETLEVSKLSQYESDVKKLAADYKKQKELLDSLPSGKAKGLAGHALARIGTEGRKARARVEIAKTMKSRGINRATF